MVSRSRNGVVAAIGGATALAVTGLTVSLAVGATETPDAALSAAVVGAFAITGAIIAAARPGNRVGWTMLVAACCWSLGEAGVDLARRGIVVSPGSVPAPAFWAVFGSAARGVGWWLVVLGVPMWFPLGRLLSARWQWLPRALIAALACSCFGAITAQDANIIGLGEWRNPIALSPPLQPISALASFAAVGIGVGATAGAVWQLYRRYGCGDALEKQQLRLFAIAASVPVLAAPVALATGAGGWMFSITVLPVPFAIAFAVLARGLYDLRTAVNRTLVWLLLSATLGVLYVVIVLGVGSRFDIRNAGWLPWVTAAAVGISFAPLRQASQRVINKLTFGRWDQPREVLAGLGEQLRAAAEADNLVRDLVVELSALGLRDVVVTDPRGVTIAGGTTGEPAPVQLPLTAYGSRVGTLQYVATDLRPRERTLLEDICGHLAGVLHVRQLTRELHHAVERLVLAREEERRRLRRDLHDGLGPALAGHLLRLDAIAHADELSGSTRSDLAVLRADLKDTLLEVRRLVEGLRPPALDELGLAGALDQAARRLTTGTGLVVDVQVAPTRALPAAVEVAAYRIVSEALTNIVRHAAASRCEIRIDHTAATVRVAISDNGRGLPSRTAGGHGLQTMRERAEELRGTLRLVSGDNGGTVVIADLPAPGASVHSRTEATAQ